MVCLVHLLTLKMATLFGEHNPELHINKCLMVCLNSMKMGYTGISYQQCTPMMYKFSLPSLSAKQCVHLSCIGRDPLYCTSMSGVWICQAKEIKFVSKVT